MLATGVGSDDCSGNSLVVMGDDLKSRGCGFESQHEILVGLFSH